jgi:hypothetical protein
MTVEAKILASADLMLAEVAKLKVSQKQGLIPFNIGAFVSTAMEAASAISMIADGIAAVAPNISQFKELIIKSQLVQDLLKAIELGNKVFSEVAPQLDALAKDIETIADTIKNIYSSVDVEEIEELPPVFVTEDEEEVE